MESLEKPELPKWVFWSTRESIDNDIPSVTAIVETIIAVPLYWWIAIYFESYVLLLVSALVAPLVLLRSDRSVLLGVKWFIKFEREWTSEKEYEALEPSQRQQFWIIAALVVLFAGTGIYLRSGYPSQGVHQWGLPLWGSFAALGASGALTFCLVSSSRGALSLKAAPIFIAGIIVSVAEGSIAAGIEIIVPFSIGSWFAIYFVSVSIRVGATIRYLGLGFRSLPRNFRRLVLCTSPRQEPELVPGLPAESKFAWAAMWEEFRRDRSHTLLKRLLVFSTFWPFVFLLWYLPAWLYRITLKSTAWFWWPLAYLGADSRRAKNPDEFRRITIGSLWAKASIGIAITTIIGFVWINLVHSGAIFKDNPLLLMVGYAFLVDWSMPPWQILTVVLALLSVALVFLVDDAGGQYRLATTQGDKALRARAEQKLRWIERLARGRFMLLLLFLIIAGGQALLYFNSVKCGFSTPIWMERQGQWLYGGRMPQNMCTKKLQGLSQ